MGAYYSASNLDDMVRISPHNFGDGYKLMEHSYLGNKYMSFVMEALSGGRAENSWNIEIPNWENKRLTWLCDYSEGEVTWENVKELSFPNLKKESYCLQSDADIAANKERKEYHVSTSIHSSFIISHTSKQYVDLAKLVRLSIKEFGRDDWVIHPLSILTNQEVYSQGGGDLHTDENMRGFWSGDSISVDWEVADDYKDITEACLFRE